LYELLKFGFAPSKHDLYKMGAIGLLIAILNIIIPAAIGQIFDDIIPNNKNSQLVILGITMLLTFLSAGAFSVLSGLALTRIESRFDATTQVALWDRILKLPTAFFTNYTSGDVAKRALSITQIKQIGSQSLLAGSLALTIGVFNLGAMFFYNQRMAFWAMGIAAVTTVSFATFARFEFNLRRLSLEKEGRLAGRVQEFFQAINKIRVAGAERNVFDIWSKEYSAQQILLYNMALIESTRKTLNATVPVLATMLFFWLAATEVGNQMSIGDFVAATYAFSVFYNSYSEFWAQISKGLIIYPVFERIKPFLETMPENTVDEQQPGQLKGDIKATNLSFSYPETGKTVIENISFHIPPGGFLGIFGPSGIGKSTLVRLLLRFSSPVSGTIEFDNKDLQNLDAGAIRKQIGSVLQNDALFPGSIYENLAGQGDYSEEECWEALRFSNLEEEIREFPMELNTILTGDQNTISGGQKQRLLIARAIIGRPKVLILDEATRALDNITQHKINNGLANLAITRVVIAHRISTLEEANNIIVLKNGQIEEQGDYVSLLRARGTFHQIAKRQLIEDMGLTLRA